MSTFTRSADSHLRASNVADVPAIAISRMPPASICVMLPLRRPTPGETRQVRAPSLPDSSRRAKARCHIRRAAPARGWARNRTQADGLKNLFLDRVVAVWILDLPWRLQPKCRPEIGFRRFEVAQHQNRGPLRHRDAGRELAAGQRDGFRLEAAADSRADRRQRIEADPRRSARRYDHLVVAPEGIVFLSQKVRRVTGGDIG